MRPLKLFPFLSMGVAGLLGGCPPPPDGAIGTMSNALMRGLALQVTPDSEVVAIVSTKPIRNDPYITSGRAAVIFGDGSPEQSVDLTVGSTKYGVLAKGDGSQETRFLHRYARDGAFVITATIWKSVSGGVPMIDGQATAAITIVPAGQPAPASAPQPQSAPKPVVTPVPQTPTPVVTSAPTPVPATSIPATPAPVTPAPVTPIPSTPVPATPEPVVTPAPTPVPPTPTPSTSSGPSATPEPTPVVDDSDDDLFPTPKPTVPAPPEEGEPTPRPDS